MPLKRHPTLIPLSHDHQKGLFTANYIRTGAPDYPGLPTELSAKKAYVSNWESETWDTYTQVEEQVLFPFILHASPQINHLITESMEEHSHIETLLSALPQTAEENLQAHFDTLHQSLVSHIRKEERQLFEAIQQTLTEAEMEALGEMMIKFRQEYKR